MAVQSYRVACLTGCGTAPELMAEASRALEAAAHAHGLRVEQAHAPVGADALVRHGYAVSHAARAAFLSADAVLLADDDDAAFAELSQELDLRARQTRVLFGSRSDSVLLSPLGDDSSAWTVRRAFALAASRRMRLTVVAGDADWERVVAGAAERHDGVRVELLDRETAIRKAAFEADSFDVVVADAALGETLAALVGATSVPARVAATAYLAEHGPSVFTPLGTDAKDVAGHGVANPSPMLLAAAMALGDGLAQRSAADTLVGALVGALGGRVSTADRLRPGSGRRGVAATTREFTDSVLAGFQNHHTNVEYAR
jgi:isocitrate/isopropylmalate dehydrogenase